MRSLLEAPPRVLRSGPLQIALVSGAFVGWAVAFIHNSSFVASDGRRYFCSFDPGATR